MKPSFATALFLLLFALCCSLVIPPPLYAALSVQVDVVGIEGPLKQNALSFLGIEKAKTNKELSLRWLKRLHEDAPEEIREALQPYGYYRPEIKKSLREVDGKWKAVYQVDKGKKIRVVKCNVRWQGEGAELAVFKNSITDYYEHAGDTLIHSKYEASKSHLLNVGLLAGYPKAKIITSKVLVDLDTNSAEINILLDTGPQYFFGDIQFEQDFLTPDLLQYYVTIKPGEPYSYDALLTFQQNLIASNYAGEVTIKPRFNDAEEMKVPLDVILKPLPPHRFAFGLGYETDFGIRGSARWTDRLINQYGHHSDLYLKLSEKDRQFKGQYFVPVRQRLTDSWVSTASYEYLENPTTVTDTVELETAFVRRNLEDTLFYKGFILRSVERFTVDTDPEDTTQLLIFGGTVRFSETEEALYPKKGYYALADLRGATAALISDTDFTRMHLKGEYMFGVSENGRFDTRLDLGLAWVDIFDSYPPSLRYFAGGDSSVRGYAFESLGPENDEGVVVGGKNLLSGSLEYDHRIAKSWVLATFIDVGNAYNDTFDKLYSGAGFGVRWLAPFGSLRLDLAWPVSEQPDIGDVRFHIGFGATL